MTEHEQKIIQHLARTLDKSYLSLKHLIFRSFISGIFYGLGATIGLAIVIFLLTLFISELSRIPFIGDYFSYLLSFLHQKPMHQ